MSQCGGEGGESVWRRALTFAMVGILILVYGRIRLTST